MIERVDGAFRFRGPLTIATVNAALDESAPLFAEEGAWELDFSAVEEVDSAAVSLLLEWARQAGQRKRELRFRHLSDNLKCLLKVYGLQELLPAS